MVRLRSAVNARQPESSSIRDSRQVLKEKTNTTRRHRRGAALRDPSSDELAKDISVSKVRSSVAASEEANVVITRAARNSNVKTVSGQDGDATLGTPGRPRHVATTKPETARRPPRTVKKPIRTEARNQIFEEMRKRMAKTAADETGKRAVNPEASDNSLINAAPGLRSGKPLGQVRNEASFNAERSSMDHPSQPTQPQQTPAVESSMLALRNFKRRPRQPSMLAMVQQRRGSMQASVANDTHVPEPSSISDLDGSELDDDGFAPEAEGTPLHVRKTDSQHGGEHDLPSKPMSRKVAEARRPYNKRHVEDEEASSTTAAPNRKRRKSSQAGGSEDSALSHRAESLSANKGQHLSRNPSVQVIHSPSESVPSTRPCSVRRHSSRDEDAEAVSSTETERNRVGPIQRDEQCDDIEFPPSSTMADPISSSPVSVRASDVDIAARGFVQPSPRQRKTKSGQPKPMTTSTLQNLLPKKRAPLRPRRRKTQYEFEDSDPENDLLVDDTRVGQHGGAAGSESRSRTQTKANRGKKSALSTVGSRKSNSSKAPNAHTPNLSSRSNKKSTPAKTYGRNTASHRENVDDEDEGSVAEPEESVLPDDSITMYEATRSKELEEVKDKFANIDDWDMEFESMSQEGHRDSSQNWR